MIWNTNIVPECQPHNCSNEVLVTCVNRNILGKTEKRVIKAVYIPYQNATVDDMGWNMYNGVPDDWEYFEEEDTWWIPQGWYEVADNFEEYSYASINGTVTAWMEMPKPYESN